MGSAMYVALGGGTGGEGRGVSSCRACWDGVGCEGRREGREERIEEGVREREGEEGVEERRRRRADLRDEGWGGTGRVP